MKKLLAALILLSAATDVFADSFNAISIQGQLNSADPIYDVKVHILSGGDVVGTATDIALLPDATDYVFSTSTYITNPWVFQTGAEYTIRLSTGTSPLTVISTFSVTAVPFALTVRGDRQTGDENVFSAYGNIGIGTTTPNYRLVVSSNTGPILWVSSSGVHATKFYGDGSGITGISGDNLGNHTAAQSLNMNGFALANVSTSTFTGYINVTSSSGYSQWGTPLLRSKNENVYVGHMSGYADVGYSSAFLGNYTGYFNRGHDNSFVGYRSGYSNIDGDSNTLLGAFAGQDIVYGNENTFVGTLAGVHIANGNDNTVIGYIAGAIMSGSNNTLVGSGAGANNNSGADNNTFLGFDSGWFNGSGDNNVFLGYQAGMYNSSGSNSIIIGANQTAGGDNTLNIGGVLYGNLASHTIGVNISTQNAALDVVSTGTVSNQFAQIWRDASGVIKSSMSATGVLMASRFIGDGSGLTNLSVNGDDLGKHVATTTLNMAGFGISNAGSVVASTYYGDGSNLTGIAGGDVYKAASQTFTGQNVFTAPARFDSTMSVTGASFSVGGSTLVVVNGRVGVGMASPLWPLQIGGTRGLAFDTAYAGYEEIPAGSQIYVPTSGSLSLLAREGTGNKIALNYSSGANYWSAAEIANPASGKGDLLLMKSGGNVGINTTTPGSTLHVSGDITVSGPVTSLSSFTATGAMVTGGSIFLKENNYIGYRNSGGADLGSVFTLYGGEIYIDNPYNTATSNIIFRNNGATERMRITDDGHLNVNNGITASSVTSTGDVLVRNSGTHTQFSIDSSAADRAANLNFYNNGAFKWQISSRGAVDSPNDRLSMFNPSGVEMLTVVSGGNVGVGTTSPDQKLTIAGNISVAGSIISSGTAANYFKGPIYGGVNSGVALQLASDGGNNQSFYIGNTVDTLKIGVYDPYLGGASIGTIGAMPLVLGVSNVEAMRIINGGNVGIGTASPAYPLDVNGSIRTANQLIVMGTATISNSGYPNLKIARTGGAAGTQAALYTGFSNFGYSGGTGADTILNSDWGIGLQVNNQSGSPSTAMLITNSGNVGIGTTSPGSKLHVNGDITAGSITGSSVTVTTTVKFADGSEQKVMGVNYIGQREVSIDYAAAHGGAYIALTKYYAFEAFTVSRMSMFAYQCPNGRKFKLGLYVSYSDSTRPNGAAVASTAEQTCDGTVDKMYTAALSSPYKLTAGQYYWLALISDGDFNPFSRTSSNRVTLGQYYVNTYASGFPSISTSGTAFQGHVLSAYP